MAGRRRGEGAGCAALPPAGAAITNRLQLDAALAFTKLTRRLDEPGWQHPQEPGRQAALASLRAEAVRGAPEGDYVTSGHEREPQS